MRDDQGLRCSVVLSRRLDKARTYQPSHPNPQLRRAPMVLGLQEHTGLSWTERGQIEVGMLWQEKFFLSPMCLSSTKMLSSAPQSLPGVCPSNPKMLV